MELGTAIKTIRKAKGFKQGVFAHKIGLSITSIVQIENNHSLPSRPTIYKIAEGLGVPISYIFAFSLTEEDIPEDRREVFRIVMPPLLKMLLE